LGDLQILRFFFVVAGAVAVAVVDAVVVVFF